MPAGAPPAPPLELDRLPDLVAPIEVVWLEGLHAGSAAERGARSPHRHDYHELIWMREGEAVHSIDGQPVSIDPGTITLIARGQVHVFERARAVTGAIVRFGEELLDEGPLPRTRPSIRVPDSEADRLEAILDMLSAEIVGPVDARALAAQSHLLSTLLLWVDRWDGEALSAPHGPAARLHARFVALLERDFASHHDTRHYADALGVPQAALARALAEATGRTTKELITDRVMVEAGRLLRFTDRSVNEISHAVGFDDQLYFSRAFKRRRGESPTAYRQRVGA